MNIKQMMKQAQQMQEQLQQKLADLKVEGSAGGGMVTAEMSGTHELLSIRVEEAVPWWLKVSTDNYAPPAIGSYRGSFAGGYRNLSGWGDSISFNYILAEGLHDLNIGAGVPVTRFDTVLTFHLREAWSEIVEKPPGFLFDIDIRNQTYGFGILQPLRRGPGRELALFYHRYE